MLLLGLFFQLAIYQKCPHPNLALFVALPHMPEHGQVSLA